MDRLRQKESLDSVATTPWDIEVFYDGDCPLCRREIDFIRRLDRRHLIRFTNIAALGFDPARYGKTPDELMAEIHGMLPSGSWVRGVEVFRRMYAALGFRPLVAITRLPFLSHALDAVYRLFAANRLKWTGRCSPHNSTCGVNNGCRGIRGSSE